MGTASYEVLPEVWDDAFAGKLSEVYRELRQKLGLAEVPTVGECEIENVESNQLIDFLEVFPEGKEYLADRLARLKAKVKELKRRAVNAYKTNLKWLRDDWFNNLWIETFLEKETPLEMFPWDRYGLGNKFQLRLEMPQSIEGLEKEIRKISWQLMPPEKRKGGLTDEEIRRAKAFPFDQLLEFNRREFAKCLWHSEKNPSLHWYRKTNTIHCFGCGANHDTISFVMSEKKVDFINAVKMLN
jgi:hypothetical protein